MTIPSFERRSFSETAVATTLASDITNSDTSCSIVSATGWPSGSSGDFYIRIESEDIRVDTRTTTTLTFLTGGRGANGTSAAAHTAGVAVTLVFTSFDADEANAAVAATLGKITGAGDILIGDAANSLVALSGKTSGRILVGNGTTMASVAVSGDATLASSGALTIANGAVSLAKLAAGTTRQMIAFTKTGTLTTGTGVIRFPFPVAGTLLHTRLAITTAPTGTTSTPISGASCVVDVNKNGTTVYTTQANRPNIQASANSEQATTAPDVTSMAAGDYLTVDIDFVGSTVAGANLTIVVYFTV